MLARLVNAYLAPWRAYATLAGRAPRMEYWTFALVNLAIGLALTQLSIAARLYSGEFGLGLFDTAFSLAALVPSISLTVRRLHDSNLSGAWFFVFFVPIIGPFIHLYQVLRRSTVGDNHFGPNPYGDSKVVAMPEDEGAPYASAKGRHTVCPWCDKTNPPGRSSCQWCHKPFREQTSAE